MHEHGPNDLPGPVRGSPGWWCATGAASDTTEEEGLPTPPAKKPRKQRKDARPIRQELVDRIRLEIEAGTYDTEEKWEAALDRLLERLDGSD
jgi:hypothetical protein